MSGLQGHLGHALIKAAAEYYPYTNRSEEFNPPLLDAIAEILATST